MPLGALSGVPGLRGFLSGQEIDERQAMAQLQQFGAAQGIAAKLRDEDREQQFRGALSAAKTPEEQVAVAARFGTPAGILQHADRQATTEATKAANLARLTQAATQNDAMMQFRVSQAKDAKEKDAAIAAHRQLADQIAAERLKYDTGATVAVPPLPAPTGKPWTPAEGVGFNFGGVSGTVPDEAAALALGRSMGFGGGQAPAAPAARPVSAPVQPQAMPEQGAAPTFPSYQGYIPPQNPDTELRRLGGGTPAPAVAPLTPQPPAVAVMPSEIARLPKKQQDAWTLQQGKASIAGAGKLTPEALVDVASQYLAGDRQAISGFARDQATKSAIQNEISKQMREKGWKGPDVAAQMADFAGIMSGSRTVGTRAAQIELASSEADKMIDIAREQSKKFERTQFVPVNVAIKAYETNTGAPEVKAFGAAVNSLVNVYARAISPSGVPTVSDKDHAREMLSTVDSPAQFQAVTDVMRQEMKAAREAPSEVRRATRSAVTGAAPAAGFDTDKERRYQEWKARQQK